MNTGDHVKTIPSDSGPTAGLEVLGYITGIIPAGVGPRARYEVTFDYPVAGFGATFDFYADQIELL